MWLFITAELLLSILFITGISPTRGQEMDIYPIWSKVELDFDGPESLGMGEPNPFQISMEIAFTGPGDQVYIVPGFYDGYGAGGMAGACRINMSFANYWNYCISYSENER
jgi:hypothetical protein